MAWITRNGSNYHDLLISNSQDDMLLGLGGNDLMLDGGRHGQKNADLFNGGKGNDVIISRWGSDVLRGDLGDDYLISRSDAGEPEIAQSPGMPTVNADENLTAVNDTLNGGIGRDVFFFRLDINASREVLSQHTDAAGNIDWAAVVGETDPHHDHGMPMPDDTTDGGSHDTMHGGDDTTDGGDDDMEYHAPHHHWVESIGVDTIQDFYRDEGDKIVIEGYSVAASIRYRDTDRDGRDDASVIRLTSEQGGMGASQGDQLGLIFVYGDFVTEDDLHINSTVYHGAVGALDEAMSWSKRLGTAADDILRTYAADDYLRGLAGNDTIIDAGRKGDADKDVFDGGDGNDVIRSHWGSDTLNGGKGDDILVSRCDAGEPIIAQDDDVKKFYDNEPFLASRDVLSGGLGADIFLFRMDLNARPSIISRHTDDAGNISWHGVAGENAGAHLHWVDSIGTDTIRDFYRADGDRIVIEGHTSRVWITYEDSNGDRRNDVTVITVRSNQGGAGSHDRDLLGTIRVYGNLVFWDDLEVNAGVHHGAARTFDEFAIA